MTKTTIVQAEGEDILKPPMMAARLYPPKLTLSLSTQTDRHLANMAKFLKR